MCLSLGYQTQNNICSVDVVFLPSKFVSVLSLEESLSITIGRCDLAIVTHARKMPKQIFVVVHPEVLEND